ncbi:ribonuclease R [Ferruginibacter yonginensis]|uniref:Ribonuclease R n=1 Tax=Ferruginibacter yonginensis TaxID=1310416 RepID=A0ABV8QNS4_9BACT
MSKHQQSSGKKKSSQTEIVKGKLEISRSGMGFVIVEDREKDIIVKPNEFGKAFHGDTVRVQILNGQDRTRRTEGKITAVVERKQTDFIGTISVKEKIAFFTATGNNPMPDFHIDMAKLNGAKDGDRVVAKFLKWDKNDKKPEGEIIAIMTAQNEGDMAMKEILVHAGFPLSFEDAVLKAADALSPNITREELKKRKDCRDILTFTIDPYDAKDFDDAISIRNLDNGNYEIGVHIADVSHFVTPGSLLDKAAYERATSVYLPDRVNPMLPEKISNELCSLRPNEDKYSFSVIFQINNRAEIKHQWIGRTIIHSNHRFTYEEVQQTIETKDGLHFKPILLLNDLAQQFRKKRFDNGAINFSSQEVKFKLDDTGKPIGIVVKESKEAHKLIEEFMLLANKAVAEYVSKIKVNKEPIPFSYRTHDEPNVEKLAPFVAFAKKHGYEFDMKDERSIATSFNNLLKNVKGKPEEHVIEQLGIRTMAKAKYTAENVGHYGLGFENYCHFTSPIRRYPDVMVHRVLQSIIDKNLLIDKAMEEKNKHCSDKERAAMEAERAGNKYKQVEYMRQFIGDEFEGVISGVSTFGFWVETVEHKCEGLVSVKDLSDYDDFRLDEANYALVGLRTGKTFRMGDDVTIRVIAANLDKRQLDYEWVTTAAPKSKQAKTVGGKSTAKKATTKTAAKPAAKKTATKKTSKK